MGQTENMTCGILNRIASIATGEDPRVRFSRRHATRDQGLARVRDELLPVLIKHRFEFDKGRIRRFSFEGGLIGFHSAMDDPRNGHAWRLRLEIAHPEIGEAEVHAAALDRRGMAEPIRPILVLQKYGAPLQGSPEQVKEKIREVGLYLDRFATHYLSTRIEKWLDMIDGEYAPGRDDIIHDRSTIPARWIPEVDRDFEKTMKAWRHATIGLNETRLGADGIAALRSRMDELMIERRTMLERYYRDHGYDTNMAPLPRQEPESKIVPDELPDPC